MSFLSTAIAAAMVKQAYSTYDYYNKGMENNKTPKRPEQPKHVEKDPYIAKGYLVTPKSSSKPVAPWKKNEPLNDDTFEMTKLWPHSWNNSLSGTGYGKRYWSEPNNPFE